MKKLLLAATLITFATPALAQEYYIVRDSSTKKCTVTETRPSSNTVVVMGNGKVYKSRADADREITTVCVEKR
jgi:hypothetical protein